MQRNITDLVEKQRTAVGLLHLPGVIGMRIGKRPFHMSEQFTLKQGLSNGAGIHADHWFQSPVGQAVNLGSQHVFPRSVLTGNQNTRVGRSNLLDRATDSRHGRSRSP